MNELIIKIRGDLFVFLWLRLNKQEFKKIYIINRKKELVVTKKISDFNHTFLYKLLI